MVQFGSVRKIVVTNGSVRLVNCYQNNGSVQEIVKWFS